MIILHADSLCFRTLYTFLFTVKSWLIFCLLFFPVTLDLSDEDGDIKNLHKFPTQYAHRILKGREVFVLIKVESKYANL